MFAVIGLGNPGKAYADTRHNAGFWALEQLTQEKCYIEANWQKKFGCTYRKQTIANQDILLIMPLKFMNLSGEASVPLLKFFKINKEKLIVIHDDLDLDPGKIRVKQGGSAGGHNGVQDLVNSLGTANFMRIRIGIGHPRRGSQSPGNQSAENKSQYLAKKHTVSSKISQKEQKSQQSVTSWVLKRPGPKDKELLDKAVLQATEAVELLITQGLEVTQRRFN